MNLPGLYREGKSHNRQCRSSRPPFTHFGFKMMSMKKVSGVLLVVLFLFQWAGAQNSLDVLVLDLNELPVAASTVYIKEYNLSAKTGGDGMVSFDDLPSGVHTVEAIYGFSFGEKTIDLSGDTTITLQIQGRVELSEIQVLSSRVPDAGPLSYSNIRSEEIQKRNYGQDLPFLLKQMPSVTVTSDAGTGIGYTGIRIRGVDPSRINVSMNGIPINDSESQNVFWVNMPDLLSSVDNIQIQRGVGTSAMGSNSFGGIVNINTNKIKADFHLRTQGSVGSFNSRRGSLIFGSGLSEDGFFAETRLSRIQSDGYIDRATADLTSLHLSMGKVSDKSSVRFNLIHGEEVTYQAWNGVPPELLDNPETRTFNSAGMERPDKPHPNEVDDYQQTHFQLFYNYSHNSNWESGLTLHYTRGKGFFEQYRSDQKYSRYGIQPVEIGDETIEETDLIRRRWLDNNFYGVILNSNFHLSESTKLITGMGWNHYHGDHFGEVIWARLAPSIENDFTYYQNDADKYDLNVFGKIEHQFGDFLAWGDVQFRKLDYRFLGFDRLLENVDQDYSESFFNPKAGLSWIVNPRTTIYSSVGISNREPNRRDFTESSPNSRPKSEKMINIEAGIRSSLERLSVQGNFYLMDYRDQLIVTGKINDVGAQIRENVDNSYRAGIELSAAYSFHDNFSLFANTTISQNIIQDYRFFVDEYDKDFNFVGQEFEFFRRTKMAYSPEQIFGGGFNWIPLSWNREKSVGSFEIDLFSQYVSRQYLDNTERRSNSIDPYYYADLNLSFHLDRKEWPGLQLNFIIRNITDQLYETNGWSYSYLFDGMPQIDQGYYPQAGRNYFAGLTISF